MIQPLRTAHRSAFVALALLLPTILIVGLGARTTQKTVVQVAQPKNLAPTAWHNHTMRSEYGRDSNAPQNAYVILSPEREMNEPDLLVYWATEPVKGNSLPSQAELLGSFAAGKRLALPPKQNSGSLVLYSLVLYSLAHRAVLDYATVERVP